MDNDIEPDDETLSGQRAALRRYFQDRAEAEGLIIRPQGAERDLNLCERLYWERNRDREFMIACGDPRHPRLNGFVKLTGPRYELQLLYISSAVGCGFEPLLWRLYRGWMHESMDEEAAAALMAETAPPAAS